MNLGGWVISELVHKLHGHTKGPVKLSMKLSKEQYKGYLSVLHSFEMVSAWRFYQKSAKRPEM